ncbi:MAG TPA: hypothetical protein LFW20_04790 [Rickettsia endosymbiont of Omalisus fontisbellaquei]|nr:hypothetical protein [Rickettsia endosymbiont of Omalisus fontisbellaquei]
MVGIKSFLENQIIERNKSIVVISNINNLTCNQKRFIAQKYYMIFEPFCYWETLEWDSYIMKLLEDKFYSFILVEKIYQHEIERRMHSIKFWSDTIKSWDKEFSNKYGKELIQIEQEITKADKKIDILNSKIKGTKLDNKGISAKFHETFRTYRYIAFIKQHKSLNTILDNARKEKISYLRKKHDIYKDAYVGGNIDYKHIKKIKKDFQQEIQQLSMVQKKYQEFLEINRCKIDEEQKQKIFILLYEYHKAFNS